MKKIISAILITISLYAENICETHLVELMNDISIDFDTFVLDKQETVIPQFIKHKKELRKAIDIILHEKPYDSNAGKILVSIMQKEFPITTANYIGLLNKPDLSNVWNAFIAVGMFTFDTSLKKQIQEYLNKNEEGFRNFFMKHPSYDKYLFMRNLGILKTQKEFDRYKDSIYEPKPEFLILDQIKYGNNKYNKNVFRDQNGRFDITYKRYYDNKIKHDCQSLESLALYSKTITYRNILKMFYISKIFPEKEIEYEKFFYAVTQNSNLWALLNFFYYKNNENYIKSLKNLEVFYKRESQMHINNKEFLKFMAKMYYMASNYAFKIEDPYAAWIRAKNGLDILNEISSKDIEIISISLDLKKNLRSAGSILIKHFSKIHDFGTVSKVKRNTLNYLNKIY